jgi:hypothetical protein
MKQEIETKKKANKMLMIPLFAVLAIGFVLATGFIVNTFVITADVNEAFTNVEYAVLGDAGNYAGESCSDESTVWMTMPETIDMDGLFPGEARKVCVRFDNLGEADLTYTLSNTIAEGSENYNECVYAFGENSVTGNALALGTTIDGEVITVPMDAAIVNDCEIAISLIRG